MRQARGFGHVDPVGPDHAGPEARWAKQARRKAKAEAKQKAKQEKANA